MQNDKNTFGIFKRSHPTRPLQAIVINQNMGNIVEFFFDKTNEWATWWWANVKIDKESLTLFKQTINILKEDMEDYH
jgi:hypothetical protein